jgi:ABC-type transport system involved in multi-copper enzyme maturation permease subunit
VIGGLQVSAGLLLLSVSAATSLAEERQRGSLDVLLATSLSTRSIVLGKWWGAFRGVPPLAVLPVLIAAALATHTGFALGPALIGGLVVAYGAAITSLGLALATWLPRMGRAIGLTAGLYLVVLIGAIPIGTILFGKGPAGARDGFAAASPFGGVGLSSAVFGGAAGPRHNIGKQAAWLVFWIVAYGLVAFGLLLATLKTFNRCLGRIDDRLPAEQPFPRPARKPATWLPDAESALDLDLRPRSAAPLADPRASDH